MTVTHSSPAGRTMACMKAGPVGRRGDPVAEEVADALRPVLQHGLVDGLVGGSVDLGGSGEHRDIVLVIGGVVRESCHTPHPRGTAGYPRVATVTSPPLAGPQRSRADVCAASTSPTATHETSIEDPP